MYVESLLTNGTGLQPTFVWQVRRDDPRRSDCCELLIFLLRCELAADASIAVHNSVCIYSIPLPRSADADDCLSLSRVATDSFQGVPLRPPFLSSSQLTRFPFPERTSRYPVHAYLAYHLLLHADRSRQAQRACRYQRTSPKSAFVRRSVRSVPSSGAFVHT